MTKLEGMTNDQMTNISPHYFVVILALRIIRHSCFVIALHT